MPAAATSQHFVVVRTAGVAEMIDHQRRMLHGRATALVLAVEQAQRIALEARAAVVAEPVRDRAAVVGELLPVGGPAGRVAERVHVDAHAAHTDRFTDVDDQRDRLRVGGRVLASEQLGADLRELAVASFLRALAAEHRTRVPETRDGLGPCETGFEVGPHERGRAFGAQRNPGAVAVLERVHLLLDDVGGVADRPLEELNLFEKRELYLPESIGIQHPLSRGQQLAPAARFGGQHVAEPFDGCDGHGETAAGTALLTRNLENAGRRAGSPCVSAQRPACKTCPRPGAFRVQAVAGSNPLRLASP
jgi:hypothetical protein